ncbi:MAG: protein tyrosine phosphatase [Eubacteriales bacterium]|nr:protein tyrosine phosphatase [Eubacteriales bacterium]
MNTKQQIIDVHAHVLPGVDDGARTKKESVKLLMMAASQGITGVFATPHYSRRRTLHGLEELTEELQQTIQRFYPDFRIYPGQETYYHEELTDRLKASEAHTMAGSRHVLVEFDTTVSYGTLFQGIRKLSASGYYPILAHMERYACLRTVGTEELHAVGCRMQMNYESLHGPWYSQEVRWCRKQVEDGKIHLLGTDMHRTDYRPPEIEEAWKWLESHISPEYLERICYQNPLCIINHKKIS